MDNSGVIVIILTYTHHPCGIRIWVFYFIFSMWHMELHVHVNFSFKRRNGFEQSWDTIFLPLLLQFITIRSCDWNNIDGTTFPIFLICWMRLSGPGTLDKVLYIPSNWEVDMDIGTATLYGKAIRHSLIDYKTHNWDVVIRGWLCKGFFGSDGDWPCKVVMTMYLSHNGRHKNQVKF